MFETSLLLSKGYITKEGLANHDKINCLSGATTGPFIEAIWETTDNDMDILEQLYDLLSILYIEQRASEMLEIIRFFCETLEYEFSVDAILLCLHKTTRSCYLFEFLMDMHDIMYDFYAETM